MAMMTRDETSAARSAPSVVDLHRELRRHWHPVALSRDVRETPVATTLLDVPLVLFRPQRDAIACLEDVCLHRGTRLSLGWMRDDGCLVCPYHGWTYDREGRCVAVPSLPPGRSIPRRAVAIGYQVQERYGLVWVLLESPELAPLVDVPQFGASGWRPTLCGPWEVESHASRVVENFLDVAHPQWVHPGLLDDRSDGVVDPYRCEFVDGVLTSSYDLTEPYPEWKRELYQIDPSVLVDGRIPVTYTSRVPRPFTVVGYKEAPSGDQVLFFIVRPTSESTSVAYLYMIRSIRLEEPDDEFREFQELLWAQDTRIVRSQRPVAVPLSLREEMHVSPADVVNVGYRRMLIALARGERADLVGRLEHDVLETD
jgi:phenylpropionate dioxygenase-like ring-hydroxylating dioxygenase large terminal subunit